MTRFCTCLGICRGAAGLGSGWTCALEGMFANTGGMSTDKMPTVDEILAKSQDLIRKGQQFGEPEKERLSWIWKNGLQFEGGCFIGETPTELTTRAAVLAAVKQQEGGDNATT